MLKTHDCSDLQQCVGWKKGTIISKVMNYIKIWLVNADWIYVNCTNTKLTSADKGSDIHLDYAY